MSGNFSLDLPVMREVTVTIPPPSGNGERMPNPGDRRFSAMHGSIVPPSASPPTVQPIPAPTPVTPPPSPLQSVGVGVVEVPAEAVSSMTVAVPPPVQEPPPKPKKKRDPAAPKRAYARVIPPHIRTLVNLPPEDVTELRDRASQSARSLAGEGGRLLSRALRELPQD